VIVFSSPYGEQVFYVIPLTIKVFYTLSIGEREFFFVFEANIN